MLIQPVANKRCASCERWSGQRQVGVDAGTVSVESEFATGLCLGGPWDNSERRARSACGHWTIWPLVAEA
ncbi:MAG: hypothetical protein PHV02_21020 [Rhodocyclaceae bacterium]|nr:hypothetical protein [Rhodocyclaceae bacterium]